MAANQYNRSYTWMSTGLLSSKEFCCTVFESYYGLRGLKPAIPDFIILRGASSMGVDKLLIRQCVIHLHYPV